MKRIAHQYLSDAALPNEASKRRQVCTFVAARECREALCRDSEFIADGQANPLFPKVKRQDAARRTHEP